MNPEDSRPVVVPCREALETPSAQDWKDEALRLTAENARLTRLIQTQRPERANDLPSATEMRGILSDGKDRVDRAVAALLPTSAPETSEPRNTLEWWKLNNKIYWQYCELRDAVTADSGAGCELMSHADLVKLALEQSRFAANTPTSEPPPKKYGCAQCGRDYEHEPFTVTVGCRPAMTTFFCSVDCRESWNLGRPKTYRSAPPPETARLLAGDTPCAMCEKRLAEIHRLDCKEDILRGQIAALARQLMALGVEPDPNCVPGATAPQAPCVTFKAR